MCIEIGGGGGVGCVFVAVFFFFKLFFSVKLFVCGFYCLFCFGYRFLALVFRLPSGFRCCCCFVFCSCLCFDFTVVFAFVVICIDGFRFYSDFEFWFREKLLP